MTQGARVAQGEESATMTVGTLARRAGIGIETVRFYEREGLLPKPLRSLSGYRKFREVDVDRLHFIRQAKDLGFTLQEIRELLALSENQAASPGDFSRLAMQKIRWIDTRIEELQTMRSILGEAIADCPRHGPRDMCPVLALFKQKGVPRKHQQDLDKNL